MIMSSRLTLPTLLTWFRVLLVPVFVIIYYIPDSVIPMLEKNLIATSVFIVAAVTDYFDGYLARKLKQESNFGAFLDPVADKALVAACLVVLVYLHRTYVYAAIVIIIREIAISALREWMAKVGQTQGTAVAFIGKLKTTFQMLAIGFLLFDYKTREIGNAFMLIAVILTLWSMFYYLNQAKKHFN